MPQVEVAMIARKRESGSEAAEDASASTGFTEEERAAMKDRAHEVRSAARRKNHRVDGERALRAKIAEMSEPERAMAERLHGLILATAPALAPTTWYGMPAYTLGDRVVCFFQPAQKFKTRYATLGFSDQARLDDGDMWATAFALQQLTAPDEARIATLVARAVGSGALE